MRGRKHRHGHVRVSGRACTRLPCACVAALPSLRLIHERLARLAACAASHCSTEYMNIFRSKGRVRTPLMRPPNSLGRARALGSKIFRIHTPRTNTAWGVCVWTIFPSDELRWTRNCRTQPGIFFLGVSVSPKRPNPTVPGRGSGQKFAL